MEGNIAKNLCQRVSRSRAEADPRTIILGHLDKEQSNCKKVTVRGAWCISMTGPNRKDHTPLKNFCHTEESNRQRRFASPCAAHNADFFARLSGKVDATECWLELLAAEARFRMRRTGSGSQRTWNPQRNSRSRPPGPMRSN